MPAAVTRVHRSIDLTSLVPVCVRRAVPTLPTLPFLAILPYYLANIIPPHTFYSTSLSIFTFPHFYSCQPGNNSWERGKMGCIIICNPITSAAHCCLRHALKKGGPSLPSLSKLYSSSIDACSSLLSRACSTLYQPAAWSKISSILCHPAICHIRGLLPQI